MVKQSQIPKADYILFIAGIISTTLVAAFFANSFFKGYPELLVIEIASYIGIVAMYIQAFRTSRARVLIQFARIVSYVAIVAAILFLSFVAYFVATFRW